MNERKYALVTLKFVADVTDRGGPETQRNEALDVLQALEDVMYESNWNLGSRFSHVELFTAAQIKAATSGVIDLEAEEESF
jgi:glutathione S-transferase